MNRFVLSLVLLLFVFATNVPAQEEASIKIANALNDVANKLSNASHAAKSVVGRMTSPRTPVAAGENAFGFPGDEVYQGDVFNGDALGGQVIQGEGYYDHSPMVVGHGVVEGMTYDAAPHVTYGAGLGTPSFGQIENGPWYNGGTWGLFPKYHRANAPHKTKVRKLRLWPTAWRR